MPFVTAPQNRIHVSVIDDVKREVQIVRNLVVFLLCVRDLAGEYLASHRLNLADKGMHVKIASLG